VCSIRSKVVPCGPPGQGRTNQGNSRDHHSFTYSSSDIGVESRILDGKSSIFSVDGSTVEFSSAIREERRVVDLYIGTTLGTDSPALEVVCDPGHRGKFRKCLQTITHPLTVYAVLVSKIESWMTRVPA
jgi:hypothetical protein